MTYREKSIPGSSLKKQGDIIEQMIFKALDEPGQRQNMASEIVLGGLMAKR
jgi:hypothetical protein